VKLHVKGKNIKKQNFTAFLGERHTIRAVSPLWSIINDPQLNGGTAHIDFNQKNCLGPLQPLWIEFGIHPTTCFCHKKCMYVSVYVCMRVYYVCIYMYIYICDCMCV
jgi:hypothetical protein